MFGVDRFRFLIDGDQVDFFFYKEFLSGSGFLNQSLCLILTEHVLDPVNKSFHWG